MFRGIELTNANYIFTDTIHLSLQGTFVYGGITVDTDASSKSDDFERDPRVPGLRELKDTRVAASAAGRGKDLLVTASLEIEIEIKRDEKSDRPINPNTG